MHGRLEFSKKHRGKKKRHQGKYGPPKVLHEIFHEILTTLKFERVLECPWKVLYRPWPGPVLDRPDTHLRSDATVNLWYDGSPVDASTGGFIFNKNDPLRRSIQSFVEDRFYKRIGKGHPEFNLRRGPPVVA